MIVSVIIAPTSCIVSVKLFKSNFFSLTNESNETCILIPSTYLISMSKASLNVLSFAFRVHFVLRITHFNTDFSCECHVIIIIIIVCSYNFYYV